jgi:DNA-directed RNA polymerase specialized sigma24 family protein
MKTVLVKAFRDSDWWGLEITIDNEAYHSQVRRLTDIENTVTDALALLGVKDYSLDIHIDAGVFNEDVAKTKKLARNAATLQAEASRASRRTVTQLRASGLTVREISRIMELSPGRISKLLQTA